MSEKTKIWDALYKTDPKHTKPFKRAGGFSGTAIKPIWMTKRLTEMFGAAGIGWGMGMPEFQTVAAGEEVLVFCTVSLWYMDGGNKSAPVYGVGGDKVLGKNKYGPFTNDEAFKASYTDALSNAMKQIGLGADIHMGLHDDDKYVRETAREFKDAPSEAVDPADRELITPGNGDQSQYDVNKRKEADAFLQRALAAFSTMSGSEMVADWYNTPISPKGRSKNRDAAERLKENFPDLGDKLETAADNARMRGVP